MSSGRSGPITLNYQHYRTGWARGLQVLSLLSEEGRPKCQVQRELVIKVGPQSCLDIREGFLQGVTPKCSLYHLSHLLEGKPLQVHFEEGLSEPGAETGKGSFSIYTGSASVPFTLFCFYKQT